MRITPDWSSQTPAVRRVYENVPLPLGYPPYEEPAPTLADKRKALADDLHRLRFLMLVQRELDRMESWLFMHPAGTHRQYVEECVAEDLLQRRTKDGP